MTTFIIGIIIFVVGLIVIIIQQDTIRRMNSENSTLRSRVAGQEDSLERERLRNPHLCSGVGIIEEFCKEKRCELIFDEENDTKDVRSYRFKYQGGHFVCEAGTDCGEVLLRLYYIHRLPYSTENLQKITSVCKILNDKYKYGKLVYSYDSETNEIGLHIRVDSISPSADQIDYYIGLSFAMATEARDMLSHPCLPSEEDIIRRQREQQMVLEGEIAHQQPFHANAQNLPRVGDLRHLMTIFFRQEEEVEDMLSMTVVRDAETEQIVQRDKIAHFNVFSTMIDGEGAEAQMRTTPAVLSLETTFRHYTFTLHPVSDNKDTIYIRLTALMVPYDNLQHDMPEGAYVPQSLSVLLTYDRDAEKTLEHYRLRSEIQKKPGNIKALYEYGHQLVLEKRFTEAVIALTPLFNTMRHNFFSSSDEHRRLFFSLCYDLGYCYTDLRQYEMAFYYLSLAYPQNRIDYSSEYFNCLANSEDIRIFRELTLEKEQIERLVKEIDNSDESGTEENVQRREQLANYYAFLQRRYGYALINCNKLDDAENVFKSLLDHAPSHDYAQHELDYIAQLKKQHLGNSEDNNTHKPLLP